MTFDEWWNDAGGSTAEFGTAGKYRAAWHAALVEMKARMLKALNAYEDEALAECEAYYKERGESYEHMDGVVHGIANAIRRVEDLKLE